jgi:predicted nucleotide-binding protein
MGERTEYFLAGGGKMAKAAKSEPDKATRSRVSQTEFPIFSLDQALRIARAIWDNFAGRGGAPHQIAMALDMSPTSGTWRNLCGSAIAYGLTDGGYNAQQIHLTDLGRRIVAPVEEDDDARGRREAALTPRVIREFFERYNRAKFPRDDIARNVLVDLGLPKDRTEQALETIKAIGKQVGIVVETKTGLFVALDAGNEVTAVAFDASSARQADAIRGLAETNGEADAQHVSAPAAVQRVDRATGPRHLFLAHGKNRKPLEDVKKILDQFKIPYKVAVDEAHAGRPISAKVAGLMRECSAGIFIFTKDEKFLDDKGGEVWRPSENVVYELGAANVLWENKIIIVKEEGVFFPSDFRDLGYISFESGGVSGKALEILKELVGLGLVSVQAAE